MPRASVSLIAGRPNADESDIEIILGLRNYTERPNDIDNNTWEFPGGAIEEGELSVDAARRELKEETGIEVAPEELSLIAVHETGDWVSFVYTVDLDADVEPKVMEPSKCELWRWTNFNDLQSMDTSLFCTALREFVETKGAIHEISQGDVFGN